MDRHFNAVVYGETTVDTFNRLVKIEILLLKICKN